MKAVLVNYNFDPEWLKDYPQLDVEMYDRSDDSIERNLTQYGKLYKTPNMGDVDADKLGWLIAHYHDLPDVFLWSKTNIFKFVDKETLDVALEKGEFMPLLKKDHRTYSDGFSDVCRYIGTEHGPVYAERADSWYFNAGLDSSGRFKSWQDWARFLNLPLDNYVPFAPGGSYILTKERVHRYSIDFYQKMRDTLMYAMHPVEAHCCERSYFYLWK